MTVTCHISVSLDGYAAGPNQSLDNPLGEGGERLHEWVIDTRSWRAQHGLTDGETNADSQVIDEVSVNTGAHVMGRKMFGGGPGPWDESWTGWWGDNPPFHTPVYVLTHHPRDPLVMAGDTTFVFVTEGIESAVAQARESAGNQNVLVSGGASTVRQCIASGLLEELYLHVPPVVLGDGERLLDRIGNPTLEQAKVVAGPGAAHLKYRLSYGPQ